MNEYGKSRAKKTNQNKLRTAMKHTIRLIQATLLHILGRNIENTEVNRQKVRSPNPWNRCISTKKTFFGVLFS